MNFSRFEDAINLIDREIKGSLCGEPKELYDATRHLHVAGGKRVRPLLCLLACDSVGSEPKSIIKSAIAVELIHTFTLVHDDMMDKDEVRRGVPSVHTLYGESTAILAGDLLFAKAFEVCDQRVTTILAKASVEICEGQQMDISFERKEYIPEAQYLEMIKKKTGVLLNAATISGAILGGGTEKEIEALSNYGSEIGMAFQIHDDVLGVIADEKNLGKPVGSDIVQGKKNIIAIKAIDLLDDMDCERLTELLAKEKNSTGEIDEAITLFRKSGAIDYCSKKAKSFVNNAKNALDALEDSQARDDLRDIADFVIERGD